MHTDLAGAIWMYFWECLPSCGVCLVRERQSNREEEIFTPYFVIWHHHSTLMKAQLGAEKGATLRHPLMLPDYQNCLSMSVWVWDIWCLLLYMQHFGTVLTCLLLYLSSCLWIWKTWDVTFGCCLLCFRFDSWWLTTSACHRVQRFNLIMWSDSPPHFPAIYHRWVLRQSSIAFAYSSRPMEELCPLLCWFVVIDENWLKTHL